MNNYGFWLYSAMTQATAALFGVIGMFIIYKLQSLRNAIKEGQRSILNGLHRTGLSYTGLELMSSGEVEEIFIKEIKKRETYLKEPYGLPAQQKNETKKYTRDLSVLKPKESALKSAQENHRTLIKNGKQAMKALGFIFVFSLAMLITRPLLEQQGFMLVTGIYIFSFIVVAIDIWRLIQDALTL